MKPIKDEKLLATFRTPGLCEICQVSCLRREPHHLVRRGKGGGTRLDIELNLVAVGGLFQCSCHDDIEQHRIPENKPFEVVAARYGMMVKQVQVRLWEIVRAPKESVLCDLCQGKGKWACEVEHLWHRCHICKGAGIMLNGEPWREQARVFH
jgi:hypothetical protein